MDGLLDAVEAWIADDPDAVTAAELRGLADAARDGQSWALDDLEDRFRGTLEFGTAGLRGELGGGPNRMNRAVVARAAAGLAAYVADVLRAQAVPDARGIVAIGYDARHGSHQFALDTASIMTAAGHEALLLPEALPTPVLAYAVRALGADAGVMVTASHNPPRDNGYKVYLGGRIVTDAGQGAQIVPPHDAEIAARIAAVGPVADIPRVSHGWTDLPYDVVRDYAARVVELIPVADDATRARRADFRVILTPLHGVGAAVVEEVFRSAGFTSIITVPEQARPDPNFPTVDFPNPEEKGAMDLALALATRMGADAVIANDPDTDRCAAALPGPAGWRMLHGDEVGSLLGERIASAGTAGVLANSIVSSQLLAKIAAAHGYGYLSTLTGFKWIGRVDGLTYGYEEALGYCVAPQLVRDKDGISAALVLAEYLSVLKAGGRTGFDALDDLARAHGVHLTRQVSARFGDLSLIGQTLARLLANPPAQLAGAAVTSADNMADGLDGLPPTSGIRLTTASGARVIVRPSGTEPKVKAYLEVIVPVEGDLAQARAQATTQMDALASDMHAALGL